MATAKAAHRRSGDGRELETTTISARRRPIVRGCGRMPKSIFLSLRAARVRITAPALRAETGGKRSEAAQCRSPVNAVVMWRYTFRIKKL